MFNLILMSHSQLSFSRLEIRVKPLLHQSQTQTGLNQIRFSYTIPRLGYLHSPEPDRQKMGSREKDQSTPHQPLLSSLVVRLTENSGGGGAAAGDYEPGEVRRDLSLYSRSDRIPDSHGFRMHAGSASPVHRTTAEHRYSPHFDRLRGSPRVRGFGGARDPERFRDYSPPYSHGRDGRRLIGRPFDGPGFGPRPFRSDGMPRNNPNVRPREGDWICPDPTCNNLNFARREQCNNCHRFRYSSARSPRRGNIGPPSRRFPGPRMNHSPVRGLNGFRSPPHVRSIDSYRSPPRGWPRDRPRDFGLSGPTNPRHDDRFPDHLHRERPDYPDEIYRERNRLVRHAPLEWEQRNGARESFFSERRPASPSPLPLPILPSSHHGRWARDIRERSRSPIRGVPPPKDFHRDVYVERSRDDHRGLGRDRIGDAY